jgi:hypothetical protein
LSSTNPLQLSVVIVHVLRRLLENVSCVVVVFDKEFELEGFCVDGV